jgi:diguanylate cyclase (GGDEF)-like protein/PAS domain S-box-containing protein
MNADQTGTVPLTPQGPRSILSFLRAPSSPQGAWVLALTLLLAVGHFLPAVQFFPLPGSYLPLHSTLEFFSMAISAMVFALAWNLREQPENSHRIILGTGLLAVCLIDLGHVLSFPGMADLVTPSGIEKTINFWLAGRYVAAAAMLAVATMPPTSWSRTTCHAAIVLAGLVTAGVWWVGLEEAEWLPHTFITGQGLTPVKIGAEYLLVLLYGTAAILLYRRRHETRNGKFSWLAAAAWVHALAEMYFTLYLSVTDTFNILGHIYKAIAYLMIYRAIFVAGVQQPFRELDVEHAKLQALLGAIPDPLWLKDVDGVYLACNKAFERLYGAQEADIIGKTDFNFAGRELAGFIRNCDKAAMAEGRPTMNEEWLTFASDSYRGLFETTRAPTYTSNGAISGLIGIAHDITARKTAEEEIKNLAFFDPLTHLANRRLILERIEKAIAANGRSGQNGALLYIDLDNFKTLNDTYGHDSGDALLQQVAERLLSAVRQSDSVARLGGDEFLVMLENLDKDLHAAGIKAEMVAENILRALGQPYQLATANYHCTSSIGITMFANEQGEDSVDDLMKRADLAMYQAKSAGRNAVHFFDPEMQSVITERTRVESDLREGLLNKQFLVYYQAQVDGEGRLLGAEALVRWQHPQRGLVSPLEFIPVAEGSGLILPLGDWVLRTACTQLAIWSSVPHLAHLTVSVNVSALQFRQHDFVAQVFSALSQTGARPQHLKLELTESLLLDDVDSVIAKMTALKEHGVGFSLDDFGTGYSSLAYLKRLPLDQLKIDQSFVNEVLTDPNDAAIARTIVTLAQSLGLGVIAEGVETQEQRDFLFGAGCHAYQGYFFSRPLPIAVFEKFAAQPESMCQSLPDALIHDI